VREKYCWLTENKPLKTQANRPVYIHTHPLLYIRWKGKNVILFGVKINNPWTAKVVPRPAQLDCTW